METTDEFLNAVIDYQNASKIFLKEKNIDQATKDTQIFFGICKNIERNNVCIDIGTECTTIMTQCFHDMFHLFTREEVEPINEFLEEEYSEAAEKWDSLTETIDELEYDNEEKQKIKTTGFYFSQIFDLEYYRHYSNPFHLK